MKKTVILLVVLILAIACSTSVAAGPAPNLSSVQIAGIGTDSEGNWIKPVNHSIYPNKLSGDTLYLCVQFVGYPNWNLVFFYQNGSLINKNKLVNYKTTYITTHGIVSGYWKYYSIPLADLPGNTAGALGQFSVKATGIRGGGYQDHVNNISMAE